MDLARSLSLTEESGHRGMKPEKMTRDELLAIVKTLPMDMNGVPITMGMAVYFKISTEDLHGGFLSGHPLPKIAKRGMWIKAEVGMFDGREILLDVFDHSGLSDSFLVDEPEGEIFDATDENFEESVKALGLKAGTES